MHTWNFKGIGQEMSEIWFFEISPNVILWDFLRFPDFLVSRRVDRSSPKVCSLQICRLSMTGKKIETIHAKLRPVVCEYTNKQTNKQTNKHTNKPNDQHTSKSIDFEVTNEGLIEPSFEIVLKSWLVDIWPFKVIQGHRGMHQIKGNIWIPISVQ